MNLSIENRFSGLGTGFLLPDDIAGIQALYGAGHGSVHSIPEPMTVLLLGTGVVALLVHGRLVRTPVRRGRRPPAVLQSAGEKETAGKRETSRSHC